MEKSQESSGKRVESGHEDRESAVHERAGRLSAPEIQFEELEGEARDEIERAAAEAEAHAEAHGATDLVKEIQQATTDAKGEVHEATISAQEDAGVKIQPQDAKKSEQTSHQKTVADTASEAVAVSSEKTVSEKSGSHATSNAAEKKSAKKSSSHPLKTGASAVGTGLKVGAGAVGVGFFAAGGFLKGISNLFGWIDKSLGKLFSGKDILGAPERFLNWLGDALEGKSHGDKK